MEQQPDPTTKNPCTSKSGMLKKRWATPFAAEFVAAWNEFKGMRATDYYHCQKCQGWHVTSRRVG